MADPDPPVPHSASALDSQDTLDEAEKRAQPIERAVQWLNESEREFARRVSLIGRRSQFSASADGAPEPPRDSAPRKPLAPYGRHFDAGVAWATFLTDVRAAVQFLQRP